jgi:hypothetical protein
LEQLAALDPAALETTGEAGDCWQAGLDKPAAGSGVAAFGRDHQLSLLLRSQSVLSQ